MKYRNQPDKSVFQCANTACANLYKINNSNQVTAYVLKMHIKIPPSTLNRTLFRKIC